MTIDILFLAKNRLEFTRASLAALEANTNWRLVRRMLVWDDGSTDGTLGLFDDFLMTVAGMGVIGELQFRDRHGSPAEIMNRVFAAVLPEPPGDIVCKIDNDTIVPPGWLDQCAAMMEAHPQLEILGLEPPLSRVPYRTPAPEDIAPSNAIYAHCGAVGGVFLARTSAFRSRPPIKPHSIYGGFGEWQVEHGVRAGWCVPPLKLFLLDRLPFEPWVSLGKEYEAQGWQRKWMHYPESAKSLWEWWL